MSNVKRHKYKSRNQGNPDLWNSRNSVVAALIICVSAGQSQVKFAQNIEEDMVHLYFLFWSWMHTAEFLNWGEKSRTGYEMSNITR